MIGRRTTVGLALLCALLFSAIAVKSASAAAATNTTAFTCVKTAVPETGTFNDAHCDSDTANKKGNFEHEQLPIGKTLEGETTNETTGGVRVPMTLKGTPFSVKTHIECQVAGGKGSGGNTETKVGVHGGSGKGTSEFTNCTVKEPLNCTVKEPIVATIEAGQGLEGLEGPKGEVNAMGGELRAEAGKPFATITLEGEKCALKGKPFPVEGSVIATSGPGTSEPQTNKWTGATAVYTAAMTSKTLLAGGKPAELVGTTTVRLKGGNPVVATTVT